MSVNTKSISKLNYETIVGYIHVLYIDINIKYKNSQNTSIQYIDMNKVMLCRKDIHRMYIKQR